MQSNGFEVHDKFYPLPERFRMGDPVLVEEVTGLPWGDFSDRLEDAGGDPAVMLGMLAVAVWQANPRWRRDRVARYVEAVDIDDVRFIGDTEEEADAGPPGGASPADADSPSKSSSPPDTSSDTTRASTTPAGLPTASPVSA